MKHGSFAIIEADVELVDDHGADQGRGTGAAGRRRVAAALALSHVAMQLSRIVTGRLTTRPGLNVPFARFGCG
jgi:hypothetical protein